MILRVSNHQNKKIIEIWANSKHEQMYVFSIKAGFKQFLKEFQKLIRKAIKQLKSKPKSKPKQKSSKINYIPVTDTTERTEESLQEVKEYQKKWYEPKTTSESQDLKNCTKETKNA